MEQAVLKVTARLLGVGLLALAVQRVVFASWTILDVKVQFVLALVAAAGAAAGADKGAVAGFALGLLFDLTGNTPAGLMALAYGLGGMTAGYVQTINPEPSWWMASMSAAAGAAVGESAIPVIDVVAGQNGWVSQSLLRVVPIVAVSTALLCTPLLPVGRWMVGAKRRKWRVIPE
ncbi:MAG: hypothetical protein ACO3C1_07015 [Ilumatobacteraceae bacterium]